ncbi:MAG: hypothetical protein JNL17_16650 [Cyclobacteriaceae bacterium]|nr:hypothetical protein [Cyclobacteriaceae bacterium]
MNKNIKIGLIIFGLVVTATLFSMTYGFYLMEIEDHYGDNQEIFFQSRQGDIAVNRDKKELGTIEKNLKRIYIINNSDTVDIWSWLDNNDIEIYRPRINILTAKNLKFADIDNLIDDKKIELIIKNR